MSQFILSGFGDEIDSTLAVQLKVMSGLGIDHIEVRGVNGKSMVDYTIDEAKEIKNEIDAHGFTVSSLASPIGKINITDGFDGHFELFKHACEIAKVLGTNRMRIFSFYIPDNEHEKYRGEVLCRLGAMLEFAENNGIILCHENECGIYGDTAERCLDIMKAFGGRMKFIFDPANFINSGTVPYPYAFDMLYEFIDYLHMKDVDADRRMVVPCGKGSGCVPEMLQRLKYECFSGVLSIEPHLNVFAGRESLEQNPHLQNSYPSQQEAFIAAADAVKDILSKLK